MVVQIFQKQEEMRAKKEFLKNVSKIYDLEDICTVIDELVERMEDVKPEFKDKFIQNLKDMKFDIVNEMQSYEEENLDLLEIWEDESEEWLC